MFTYIIDIGLVVVLLFSGIKYLKTREYDDKKDIYTDESKEKAALICGVMCTLAGIAIGVIAFLKYNGTLTTSFENGLPTYYIPFGIVIAVIIIVLIYIYAAVLKKK